MYINGRVKILLSESRIIRITRIARIVEFVYQGAIHKGCASESLLITYLLCKNAYRANTSLNSQINNPRNPCPPRFRQVSGKIWTRPFMYIALRMKIKLLIGYNIRAGKPRPYERFWVSGLPIYFLIFIRD